MRRLIAGIVFAVLTASSAVAAEPAGAYRWSGFYAGANVGYSWGGWHPTSNFPIFDGTTTFFPPNSSFVNIWDCNSFGSFCSTRADVRGAIGGGQAGYNWQSGKWLLGIEGDLQATGQKRQENGTVIYTGVSTPTCSSAPGSPNPCKVTTSYRFELPWLGTLRGRVGFVADQWLFFATGGLAVGEARSSFSFAENQGTNVAWTTSDSAVKAGWTLGAGVEAAVGKNWSIRTEYLFVDLGSRTLSATNPTGYGPAIFNQSFKVRDNIVRVGVNYLFNSGTAK